MLCGYEGAGETSWTRGKGTLVSKVPVISKLQKRPVYDGQKQPTESVINDHYEKLHPLVIRKS